ncbi:MAG: discoidin domain-containing protein, partial [Planctomycetota bacterium]|nr:discoidin domain-containing protein [Planctomycetota bacterium]
APAEWDWFALDDVPYQNRRISIVWDRLGTRYGKGQGLSVIADGEVVATSRELARLAVTLPPAKPAQRPATNEVAVNFAVNNDGTYYPRISASHTAPNTSISKANDGNFWYHPHPPNRWTCEGSPRDTDTVLLEFGVPRAIHTVKLFFLDDSSEPGGTIRAPRRVELEAWVEERWMPIELEGSQLEQPAGHRANAVHFPTLSTSKLRATLHHQSPARSGLTEFEAWGDAPLPVEVAAPPAGNLAYNPKPEGYPKASASFTDRFGGKPHSAIDGKTVFLPTPMNRWTSYDSKTPTDWLEIDFGKQVAFSRIELAIYDDRGGVQPPTSYVVETWVGNAWKPVEDARRTPAEPAGGVWNEIRLTPIQAVKLRIVFTHKGQARSGVTEVMVWND